MSARQTGNYTDTNALANVTVMGVQKAVNGVSWNGKALQSSQWSYNGTSSLLEVVQLNSLTANGAWSSNWTLEWA